jgi:hypothetical protein
MPMGACGTMRMRPCTRRTVTTRAVAAITITQPIWQSSALTAPRLWHRGRQRSRQGMVMVTRCGDPADDASLPRQRVREEERWRRQRGEAYIRESKGEERTSREYL